MPGSSGAIAVGVALNIDILPAQWLYRVSPWRCAVGAHTARTLQTRQVFLGLSSEVWFHRFLAPPFGSPFHPSLSHTHLFSSFLSCPPAFISPLLSFARTLVQPLVCTCAFTPTSTLGFRLPRFDNEVAFHCLSLCTWFLFITTTYTFVLSCPLFSSSSSCPCCVHTCTIVLALAFVVSPCGRHVCVTLQVRGILLDL